jgi:hypothetical protein
MFLVAEEIEDYSVRYLSVVNFSEYCADYIKKFKIPVIKIIREPELRSYGWE